MLKSSSKTFRYSVIYVIKAVSILTLGINTFTAYKEYYNYVQAKSSEFVDLLSFFITGLLLAHLNPFGLSETL